MGFVNKVMLMGNTTRDAELRTLPSGTTICEFALATNRVYKTTSGEEKQETVFIDCTAFGRTGEVIAEYCPKGRQLFVEGRLHYETWEDKNGNRRSKLSVIVESFQFVGGREGVDSARQRELPLAQGVGNEEERSTQKSVSPAGPSSMQRRGTTAGNTERFQKGQRPAETSSAMPAARTSRKIAGKPARAAVGAATGEETGERKADSMAQESRELEDADLPF
jgi:single-strand DNA-binding protein